MGHLQRGGTPSSSDRILATRLGTRVVDMIKNIICTLGPASHKKETIMEMADSGMCIARLNFSHGDHRQHQIMVDTIREINQLWTKSPEVQNQGLKVLYSSMKLSASSLERSL